MPDFTTFLQEFTQEHSLKFNEDSEEQPLECYSLWQSFTEHVDGQLEIFLKDNGLEQDSVYASLDRMKHVDPGLLSSIDYLIASSDYQEFVYMMLEFKDMNTYVDEGSPEKQDG